MALAMMRMIKPPGRVEGGSVLVGDTDLTKLNETEMRHARLSKIAYIPQGAMNSLNPVLRIENQMRDGVKAHEASLGKDAIQMRIEEALESVELKRSVARMYPHELSGGMKQRVCIAIGILLKPQVIIADEPTSALDVVTQRQVMETLDRVQKQLGAAIILIGHDMGLMAQFVDKVAVMYAGKLTEVSTVREMFTDEDLAKRYPPIMTYKQTAELVQVSVNTLKGWFCQGKYPKCVKRRNPGRVQRDVFVQQFMRDEFGINDE